MIKAVIFECFGVVISDALEAMMVPVRTSQPDIARKVVDALHGHNRGLLTPEASNAQLAELLGLSRDEYERRIMQGEVKNVALVAYIRELRRSYKTAMLSNIDGPGLRRRFHNHELEELFDVVVASGDIGYAKPDSQAYQITAEQLGVRLDECIFTDDREPYCEGARRVGMQAILYEDINQFTAEFRALT
jgi:HAD superfamily hydrolase (TIGR01509 family)